MHTDTQRRKGKKGSSVFKIQGGHAKRARPEFFCYSIPMEQPTGDKYSERLSFEETDELLREIHVEQVANQFSNRVITLVIASLGLTTALACYDTLKQLFQAIFGAADTLGSKLLYSILVTLIAVLTTLLLARFLRKRRKK